MSRFDSFFASLPACVEVHRTGVNAHHAVNTFYVCDNETKKTIREGFADFETAWAFAETYANNTYKNNGKKCTIVRMW